MGIISSFLTFFLSFDILSTDSQILWSWGFISNLWDLPRAYIDMTLAAEGVMYKLPTLILAM